MVRLVVNLEEAHTAVGNSHFHWHIASLPPRIPYEKQQFAALDSKNGVWELTNFEKGDLANRLRHRVQMLGGI